MEQFTAIEVRDAITWKYGDKLTRISAMLTAFADMLEAREIARNDSIEREYERENNPAPSDAERLEPPSNLQEALCVIENAALHGVTLHGDDIPRLRATVDRIAPAQQSQDAERLAEALRELMLQWRSANPHGTDKPMTVGAKIAYTWCAEQVEEILAAHSAQAQRIHPDVAKAQAIPFDVNDGRPTRSAQAQPPANQDKPVYAISRSMHSYYTQDEEEARQAEFDGANVQRIPAQPPAASVTGAVEVSFEIWQDDEMVAECSGPEPSALHEARHYAAQYSQDGAVKLFRVSRVAISAVQENPNGL